jgi:DNA-binding transcriptional LysR family regulator
MLRPLMLYRSMEIFCDVASRRSFSKGAAAQRLSQSFASQTVRQLEKHLGVELINRSLRPLELTEAGQLYYEGCRDVLDRYRTLEDRVRRLQHAVVGEVRIAAIYSVGLLQMERRVRRFNELYPEAEMRLEYVHPDEVYEQVRNDEADLGLVSFPRRGTEYEAIPWQNQRMVLAVSPEHRLAGRGACPVRELAGEPFIGFTDDLAIRRAIDRWLRSADVDVELIHEFDNIETIKQSVSAGSGVALLPGATVEREAKSGVLSVVRLSDVAWSRPLAVLTKRGKQLSNAARKAVELLQQDLTTSTSSTTQSRNERRPKRMSAAAAAPTAGRRRKPAAARRRT